MKTQHTPLPWVSVKKAPMTIDDIEISIHTIETKFGPIARVIGSESNAALIATSPELLKELEELVDIVENLMGCSFWEHSKEDENLLKGAKAAIKKAKGI